MGTVLYSSRCWQRQECLLAHNCTPAHDLRCVSDVDVGSQKRLLLVTCSFSPRIATVEGGMRWRRRHAGEACTTWHQHKALKVKSVLVHLRTRVEFTAGKDRL